MPTEIVGIQLKNVLREGIYCWAINSLVALIDYAFEAAIEDKTLLAMWSDPSVNAHCYIKAASVPIQWKSTLTHNAKPWNINTANSRLLIPLHNNVIKRLMLDKQDQSTPLFTVQGLSRHFREKKLDFMHLLKVEIII